METVPIKDNSLRIGIISLWWLPLHGGTEHYGDRLACYFAEHGFDVAVCTAFSSDDPETNDQAVYPVARLGGLSLESENEFLENEYSSWCERVIQWCKDTGRTHVLINAHYYGGIVSGLKKEGIEAGLILHDFANTGYLARDVIKRYWQLRNWDEVLDTIVQDERNGKTCYHKGMTILQEEWSFFIFNSFTTAALVEPGIRAPYYVIHPPVQSELVQEVSPLSPKVTVAALNPSLIKGSLFFADMVWGAPPGWSFRILRHAWGEEDPHFIAMTQIMDHIEGRLYREDMVPNIADFYCSSDIFVCPSRHEGYGMAPVEALYCGTPVIVTDLPTIREGVGDGGMYVPYFSHAGVWIEAIQTVLACKEKWIKKAEQRRAELESRQEQELKNAIPFIASFGDRGKIKS